MKKVLKVLLIIVIIIAVVITSGILYITSGLKTGANLELSGIDAAPISDGTYDGKYNAGRFSNTISVTVKDGRITGIKLIDDATFANAETAQEVFNRVIKEQNTTVDVVTGATVTSKAYLSSIENALNRSSYAPSETD